eukprot:4810152-Amphidinium_carterae.2
MCLIPLADGELWIEDALSGTSVEQDEKGHEWHGTWHAMPRVFLFSASKRHMDVQILVIAATGNVTLVILAWLRGSSRKQARGESLQSSE